MNGLKIIRILQKKMCDDMRCGGSPYATSSNAAIVASLSAANFPRQ